VTAVRAPELRGGPGAPGPTDAPLVSLIVLNWNGLAYLPRCLGSLRRQTYRRFETILVDNGSTDGSASYVRTHFPEVRLIETGRNLGFAEGNNVGIRQARGELIGLLNNDTEAAPTWLEELVRALQRAPERVAGVCGTVCALEDPGRVTFTLPKIDPRSAAAYCIRQESPPRLIDYLAGNSMLVRRSVIAEVGLLDPAYFAYYEDTDWSARMIRAGYDLLYVPTAVIAHKTMGTAAPDWHYHLMARNRLRFALKNFDAAYLPGFLLRYARDLLREAAANRAAGRAGRNRLLLIAVLWNLRHLPATLAARRADRQRLRTVRSYNRNLPLRSVRCTADGGYIDESAAPGRTRRAAAEPEGQ
jgi:GT2 family glycosyltransferase